MQFTGHSLPVHQSMSVPWYFTLSILSAKSAYTISSHNCHRNVSLPSSASLWNACLAGSKVNIQHVLLVDMQFHSITQRKNRGFLCKLVADNLPTKLEKCRYLTRLYRYMNRYQSSSCLSSFVFNLATGGG